MREAFALGTLTTGGRPYLWLAASGPPAALSAEVLTDATIELDGSGSVLVTVLSPPDFAGSYDVELADLASGPVSLVAPGILGTASTGETLTVEPGLWLYSADAGEPVLEYDWQANGTAIAGATGESLVLGIGQAGREVTVRESATDQNGARNVVSAGLAIPGAGAVFSEADGAIVVEYLDPIVPIVMTGTDSQIDVEAP